MKAFSNLILISAVVFVTSCTSSSSDSNSYQSGTGSVMDTSRLNAPADTSVMQGQYEENGKQSSRTYIGTDTTGKSTSGVHEQSGGSSLGAQESSESSAAGSSETKAAPASGH
ncbi:MAG: hypothetical protein H7Y13_07575 [Sphingobacteriaceae bacterium]|nr:hypothetical protein [Sphingobacteriaceae bacterium]